MKSFAVAVAFVVATLPNLAFAKIEEPKVIDMPALTLVVVSEQKAVSPETANFIPKAIGEVKKFLDSKNIKTLSAVNYVNNNVASAGFTIEGTLKDSPPFKVVRLPANKALKTTVRGPFTEIPTAYQSLATKFKNMPNVKTLNQWIEIYQSPAGTPQNQAVTDLVAYAQITAPAPAPAKAAAPTKKK